VLVPGCACIVALEFNSLESSPPKDCSVVNDGFLIAADINAPVNAKRCHVFEWSSNAWCIQRVHASNDSLEAVRCRTVYREEIA
jgi:hypothetical protein